MAIIKPDPISLTTHHLYLGFGDSILGTGTGFTYKHGDDIFLITNWHNVTGKHPDTKKCLRDDGGLPDIVSTMFRDPDKPGNCTRSNIPLYLDEDRLQPVWYEHPVFRERVDVVAIPLSQDFLAGKRVYPINDIQFNQDFRTEVSDETFIIGYPFSEDTYAHLPIWKKASIATEPDVNLDQLPKMLVDTATRSGLSGSPVIMQRTGVHGMVGGEFMDDSIIGVIRNFIGVYSGRIGKSEFKAQLGIVWKEIAITEIIEGKHQGKTHF